MRGKWGLLRSMQPHPKRIGKHGEEIGLWNAYNSDGWKDNTIPGTPVTTTSLT
jgi:hypothetical protein